MASLTLAEFADRVAGIMPALSREFLKHQSSEFYKIKITLPQLIILDILSRGDEMKMTDIARNISVTTAAMTGIIDRLVRDGYVVRANDPEDRRVIKVKLTRKGSRIATEAHEQKRKATMKMFGVLSTREREDYLRILNRIMERVTA